MILAQFATPPEELSVPLWPLVLLAVLYAVCFVAARVVSGRGDSGTADTIDTIAFGLMLLAGLYTVILAVYALSERSDQLGDAVEIMLIVFGFFALLLVFMLLLELLIGVVGRARQARRTRGVAGPSQDPPRTDPPSEAPAG
jgi:tellurite resistance protein TehA-like permease